jgi:hypothetical protein
MPYKPFVDEVTGYFKPESELVELAKDLIFASHGSMTLVYYRRGTWTSSNGTSSEVRVHHYDTGTDVMHFVDGPKELSDVLAFAREHLSSEKATWHRRPRRIQ